MDVVAGLLDGPRARGAFLLRSTMEPPWSLRVRDEAALSVVAVVRGQAWILPETDDAVRLGPGDVAILRGPEPYTVADAPNTRPQVAILPGQVCVTAAGEEIKAMNDLGVRTWGNSADGSTVLLTGTYPEPGEVGGRLLRALPTMVVMPAEACPGSVLPLLVDEVGRDQPGQEAVLDRLLDVLLVAVLREWFARPEAHAPGWYRAHGDPVVGPALRAIHDDPAHPWTVAALATQAGVSRRRWPAASPIWSASRR